MSDKVDSKKEDKMKEQKGDGAQKTQDNKPTQTDQDRINELTDALQRLQAEFENYKKYADKEKLHVIKFAKAELMQKLLTIVDTFDIALKSTENQEKFVHGMRILHNQLAKLLEHEGLKPIKAENQKLDPHYHEVLLKQPSDKEAGVILEVLQKGYLLHDKVLRYAKVKVSSGQGAKQNPSDEASENKN